VRSGNAVENLADAVETVELIVDLGSDIVLPETVSAVMRDNSRKEIPVQWDAADLEAMKNGGVAKYTVTGIAGGMKATCNISMVEYNYLQNWSFEDGDAHWTATPMGKMAELYVEDKSTDSVTGTKHYHFWDAGADAVEFTLEQEVKNLKSGNYSYSISIMGGDGGQTEIYAYVKINGKIVATGDAAITVYNEWHKAAVESFEYTEGDSIVVGIYVKCAGPNAWGKIDDAKLNSVK
jgi:arabinogalactan endo-1,4-beta-galactosidase